MRKNAFIKIFSLALCLVLLVFVAGIVSMHKISRNMLDERLVDECDLVLSILKDKEDIINLENYYTKDAFRITVTDTNGEVLHDSESNTIEFENHADREEIIYALNGESKTVERYSETFDCKMTYYAKKTTLQDGTDVVLRLAVRSSEITEYVIVSIPFLIGALVIAIGFSLWFSKKISKDVSEKMTQIGQSLKSLNEGEYIPIRTDSSDTELHSVLKEINEINANVHKTMASQIRESKKLGEVLDNVSQGIIALNPNNEVVFANNSVLLMMSARDNCVGRHLNKLLSDARLVEKITQELDKNIEFEYKLDNKDIYVLVKRIEDTELEGIISRIAILTDVTTEKLMVKQKSDFFANASHELKTPITVMQGLTEILLSKETIDEATKKHILRIHNESIRMASLISDMLKLSKLERSEDEPVLVNVDLRNICDEAINELANQISEKNIRVTLLGEGEITADPRKIFELVTNLCTNAINYNRENGEIEISIHSNDDSTTLAVRDTGIGIEKEHIPRLCERFYRVDKSRSKKTGGTGLGLAIVKHICALYNAELSIQSEINVGTTVRVEFKS